MVGFYCNKYCLTLLGVADGRLVCAGGEGLFAFLSQSPNNSTLSFLTVPKNFLRMSSSD